MKVYFSEGTIKLYKAICWFLLIASLIIILSAIVLKNASILILLLGTIGFALITLASSIYSKKLFYYSEINEDKIISYSYNDENLYFLDMNKEVYYAIFSFWTKDVSGNYIVLSNEKFDFDESYNGAKFVKEYDERKMLILPYDKSVILKLKLEDWVRVWADYKALDNI